MTSPMVDADGAVVSLDDHGRRASSSPTRSRSCSVRVQRGCGRSAAARCTFVDDGLRAGRVGQAEHRARRCRCAPGTATARHRRSTGTVTSVASEVDAYRGASADRHGPGRRVRPAAGHRRRVVHQRLAHRTSCRALVQDGGALRVGTIDLPTAPVKYVLRNDTAAGPDRRDRAAHRPRLVRRRARRSRCGRRPPAARRAPQPRHRSRWAWTSIAFSARQVGDGATTVTVRGWDPVAQSAVVGTSTTPDVARRASTRARGGAPTYTRVDARAATRSPERRRRRRAAAHRRPHRPRHRDGRGASTPRGWCPAVGSTVDGAGPSNGNYYVREVDQHFDGRQRDHAVRRRRPRPGAALGPVGDRRAGVELPAQRARRRDRRQRQRPRRAGPRPRLAGHRVGRRSPPPGPACSASARAPTAGRWSCPRSATRCSSASRTTTSRGRWCSAGCTATSRRRPTAGASTRTAPWSRAR